MEFQVQQYMLSCESYLLDPQLIEPNDLAQYFSSYSQLGVNDHITSLVQRYFYLNLNHPELLRYIQLLDRLVKLAFPLPKSFVNMFAECFSHSVYHGRKSIQQELKILRKIWTPVLQDELIEALRIEVFRLTKIDIEMELRQESAKFLNQYFQKYLKMNPRQIQEILKKKAPLRIALQPISFMEQGPFPSQIIEPRPPKARRNPEIEQRKSYSQKKRQLTNREKAQAMIDQLNKINGFSCKQCGKFFQSEKSLTQHQEEHFEQKMKNFKQSRAKESMKGSKGAKKQPRRQMNLDEWCYEQATVNICSVQMDDGRTRHCQFCGCEFVIQLVGDCFVYQDTIKVREQPKGLPSVLGQNNYDLMHGDCYKILMTCTQFDF